MKEQNQLRIFNELNDLYQGGEPFHLHVKGYYRSKKNIGSKDRRLLSSLSYDLFRLGKALPLLPREERMVISSYLCETSLTDFHTYWFGRFPHFASLTEKDLQKPLKAKLAFIKEHYLDFNQDDVFPFSSAISKGISRDELIHSLFVQPLLWIRVKPALRLKVTEWLQQKGISWEEVTAAPCAIGLPPRLSLPEIEKEIGIQLQVQDLSSQITGSYFSNIEGESWWDCCAASGGKSLLLKSRDVTVKLYVSDIRPAILANLHSRFQSDGIKDYNHAVIDLSQKRDALVFQNHPSRNKEEVGKEFFDNILLDAPCSGSGTWARTPEMLSSFSEGQIAAYHDRQVQIAENVVPFLKKGGSLYYITCSVFKAENEDTVQEIMEKTGLQLREMKLITGFRHRADNMFIAVLSRAR